MHHAAGHDVHVVTRGSGPTAHMIHCALSRLTGLLPLADMMPYRTTLFDMPGHGQSGDWDGKAEYQGMVTDIAASLCEGPTHVIGHSFGATVALRLAVKFPHLVSRLTLIEPVYFAAAKATQAHADHARNFRPFVGAMLQGNEVRAAQIFHALWNGTPWQDLSARQQADRVARIHLIVAGAAAIEEDPEGITHPATLEALRIPVTLIRGEKSPNVIAAIHAALVDRIPGAADHVVVGAGHMLPMTHPQQVASIMRAADQETY